MPVICLTHTDVTYKLLAEHLKVFQLLIESGPCTEVVAQVANIRK